MHLPSGRISTLLALLPLLVSVPACTTRAPGYDAAGLFLDAGPLDGSSPEDSGFDGGTTPEDSGLFDGGPLDAPITLDPDAGCAMGASEVEVQRRPVDIIWMVDNSGSMQPAIEQVQAGLNAFAANIAARDLDYRVIMLSLRGRGLQSNRYRVCIPPPLAGDASCGDGERFFQVEIDVLSTQLVEQFIGTLAQSNGYVGHPWSDLLRPDATKTIVFVTDDNSRTCDRPHQTNATCIAGRPPLTVTSLEDYPGGLHPFGGGGASPRALGPGILTAEYGTLFEGYTFNALYGWGSDTDPDVRCTYPGGGEPDAAGHTYTALVQRTGGVRAKICDGAAAWGPFFDAVASTVAETSRIECEVAMPAPPEGTVLDPTRVNVQIRGASGSTPIPYAGSADACDPTRGGWHYDDPSAPTRVVLCPSTCDFAREETATTSGAFEVVFGCLSIPI